MTEEVENILKCYDFQSADGVEIEKALRRLVDYVKTLEADRKTLEEIIAIQRHNLALLRKEKNRK